MRTSLIAKVRNRWWMPVALVLSLMCHGRQSLARLHDFATYDSLAVLQSWRCKYETLLAREEQPSVLPRSDRSQTADAGACAMTASMPIYEFFGVNLMAYEQLAESGEAAIAMPDQDSQEEGASHVDVARDPILENLNPQFVICRLDGTDFIVPQFEVQRWNYAPTFVAQNCESVSSTAELMTAKPTTAESTSGRSIESPSSINLKLADGLDWLAQSLQAWATKIRTSQKLEVPQDCAAQFATGVAPADLR